VSDPVTGNQPAVLAFDETRGEWRVTASYEEPNNVTFYRNGQHYKTGTCPGYKIWNVLAHLDEIIADFEETSR